MQGYTEQMLDRRLVETWRFANAMVERFQDSKDAEGGWLRCHEIARAVLRRLPPQPDMVAVCVDGHFGMHPHSWIELSLPNKEGRRLVKAILDTYAIARLPVCQLIDADPMVPGFRLYKIGKPREDVHEGVVAWLANGGT